MAYTKEHKAVCTSKDCNNAVSAHQTHCSDTCENKPWFKVYGMPPYIAATVMAAMQGADAQAVAAFAKSIGWKGVKVEAWPYVKAPATVAPAPAAVNA